MPASAPAMVRYEIVAAERLVIVTGNGDLTAHEIIESQNALRADPAFDPTFAMLADYRSVTSTDLDRSSLMDIAQNAPVAASARRAFLVRGQYNYGMARMYGILNDLERQSDIVRVFEDDMDGALAWVTAGSGQPLG
jgi:hypothetical protein